MAQKPVSCQFCDPVEGTRLFEEVSRSGNDLQLHFGAHFTLRLFIERDHYLILAADDQQRWSLHFWQCVAGEIRPASAGHDGCDIRKFSRGDEGGCGPGARAKIADIKLSGIGLFPGPFRGMRQPLSK